VSGLGPLTQHGISLPHISAWLPDRESSTGQNIKLPYYLLTNFAGICQRTCIDNLHKTGVGPDSTVHASLQIGVG
jgi:hypothetical protein